MKNIKKSTGYLIVATFWMVVLMLVSTRTQAQQNWCDSLEYFTLSTPTLTVTGDAMGISNMVDSIRWNFTACNSTACYIPQGNDPYSFPLINSTDTVKLCYDAFIYYNGTTIICNHCDSLVYDTNSYSWVLFNMSNPVGLPGFVIEEEGVRWWNDVIYDMQGRELKEIPIGVMYIRGGKINLKRK